MAYSTWADLAVQFGREATAGTAVAATDKWRGVYGGIEVNHNVQTVDENVGIVFPTERSYKSWTEGTLQLPASPMTFEQCLHIFEASIDSVTPTGAGPYVYTYETAPAGGRTPKYYTVETGDLNIVTADSIEMNNSFVSEWRISGNAQEAWTIESTWMGRNPAAATMTGALSLTTVEECLFPLTKLYIDATGGTFGTTQESGVLLAADIRFESGIQFVPVGDGNLYPAAGGTKLTRPNITGTFTLELDSTANTVVTERAFYDSQAVRLLRLQIEGSTPANDTINIDVPIKYDSVAPYVERDGNTTVQFAWHGVNDPTDGDPTIEVTNGLAAVP